MHLYLVEKTEAVLKFCKVTSHVNLDVTSHAAALLLDTPFFLPACLITFFLGQHRVWRYSPAALLVSSPDHTFQLSLPMGVWSGDDTTVRFRYDVILTHKIIEEAYNKMRHIGHAREFCQVYMRGCQDLEHS